MSGFCRWVPAGLEQSSGIGRRTRLTTRKVELPTRGSTFRFVSLGQRHAPARLREGGNLAARPAEPTANIKKKYVLEKRILPSGFCIGYWDVLRGCPLVDTRVPHYKLNKVYKVTKAHLISQREGAKSLEFALSPATPVSAQWGISASQSWYSCPEPNHFLYGMHICNGFSKTWQKV